MKRTLVTLGYFLVVFSMIFAILYVMLAFVKWDLFWIVRTAKTEEGRTVLLILALLTTLVAYAFSAPTKNIKK